jgi:alkylation response protein AidB-like acyl-CoA dehydrogenase
LTNRTDLSRQVAEITGAMGMRRLRADRERVDMTSPSRPSREELVGRTRDLIHLVSAHAEKMEQDRRLSADVVKAVSDAGLLRLRVPARYGGYESDLRTVLAVTAELARADVSTAWVIAVQATAAWLAAFYPDAAQREVFDNPNAGICAVLQPAGTATPISGGLLVTGAWPCAPGAWHSDWALLAALQPGPDGVPEPVSVLIPLSDLTRIDDWQTSGLRASGSITLTADHVVVPGHRSITLGPTSQERSATEPNAGKPVYWTPAIADAAVAMTGPLIGGVRAALDSFLDRLPGRGIAFTAYRKQSEAPVTQLQVAEASLLLDEARFHARRAAVDADAKAESGREWSVRQRARLRADAGRAAELARKAVQLLGSASGGSLIRLELSLRRVISDVEAISLNGLLQPTTTAESYGRILVGLEPDDEVYPPAAGSPR